MGVKRGAVQGAVVRGRRWLRRQPLVCSLVLHAVHGGPLGQAHEQGIWTWRGHTVFDTSPQQGFVTSMAKHGSSQGAARALCCCPCCPEGPPAAPPCQKQLGTHMCGPTGPGCLRPMSLASPSAHSLLYVCARLACQNAEQVGHTATHRVKEVEPGVHARAQQRLRLRIAGALTEQHAAWWGCVCGRGEWVWGCRCGCVRPCERRFFASRQAPYAASSTGGSAPGTQPDEQSTGV